MRVAALGVLLWLASCDRGGYRVLVHVPGEAARVVRAEVSVIGSCDEILSMGLPPAATVQSVVVGAEGSTSIGAVPEGKYGLYGRAWEPECVLFAAGCDTIAVDGGGGGDLHVFLSIITPPLGCDAGQRCSGELCVPLEGCGDTPCSDDQVCRVGECVDAQADHDGDGYVAAVDCDDDDPEIVPGIRVPCTTPCAAGQRACLSDGSWTECSAPDECHCSDGQVREEPCGRCGTSERRCGDDGRWGGADECAGEGECQAGETQQQPCDPCGTQVLRCSDQCDWVKDECVHSPEADEDDDGFDSVACGGADCDDDDPEINPGAADGWMFETVDSEGLTGWSPSLALGADGEVHIAYRDVLNGALRHAVDDGAGWTLETVDSEGDTGSDPSLALGPDGEVHIAYRYDSSNEASHDLRHAVNDGVGWTLETVDLVGPWGGQPSLALDAAGNVHIAYRDRSNDNLRYAVNDGARWALDTVDSVGVWGGYPSLALGAAGETHIAYSYDDGSGQNHDLLYAVDDGAGWSIETMDSEGDTSSKPSLALGAAGEVHIAYRGTNYDLRYAVNDGAGWTISAVDSGAFLFDPSLALGTDGEVHIAYSYDDGSGVDLDLRYAVGAGAQWTVETMATWGDSATIPSLALGAAGEVHIAYYDWTDADLEYAFRDAVDQNCDGLLSE